MKAPKKPPKKYIEVLEFNLGYSSADELKEFIVFGYSSYYPSGGLSDILESFETLEEAKTFIENDYYPKEDSPHFTEKWWRNDFYNVIKKSDWLEVLSAKKIQKEIHTA